jgi:hypothetical protein
MKKCNFLPIILLMTAFEVVQSQDLSMNAVTAGKDLNSKTIIWLNPEVDMGTIEFEKPAMVAFNFKNNSDEPVIIKNVRTSCGCTAANYSNTVIKPGESSKIEVTYNAKSKGYFSKTITVNTSLKEENDILTLKGTVN